MYIKILLISRKAMIRTRVFPKKTKKSKQTNKPNIQKKLKKTNQTKKAPQLESNHIAYFGNSLLSESKHLLCRQQQITSLFMDSKLFLIVVPGA